MAGNPHAPFGNRGGTMGRAANGEHDEGYEAVELRLDGKVALITGSDSGIGRGIATLFAESGADIAVHYYSDREGAEETARQVRETGRKAIVVQADIGAEADVERIFGELDAAFGQIDIMVNNAGQGGGGPIHKLDPAVWDRVMRTNLYGPFFCSRLAGQRMVARGQGGRILNITSVHQEAPSPGSSPYLASKGGLRNLTRTTALDLAPYGITANNIAPGMILTPMNQTAVDDADVRSAAEAQIPMLRAGTPADIAHMALFLASDAASYCTGSTFFVDGGWMLNQPPV
jgi:glucose 1-dehydrogenase